METITITATLPEAYHIVKNEEWWVLWCNGEESIRGKSLANLLAFIPGCAMEIKTKYSVGVASA